MGNLLRLHLLVNFVSLCVCMFLDYIASNVRSDTMVNEMESMWKEMVNSWL